MAFLTQIANWPIGRSSWCKPACGKACFLAAKASPMLNQTNMVEQCPEYFYSDRFYSLVVV
ncbi:hypothetical protein APS_2513 [Acetobacter pasteurianus subsp. pasteurianus LMG 1262 = NBRC 106471]|nr:hypothetical protein APS_2513 [Acetobacter pasteurianus subsp. pasteurianus LMG 1262 = NBRC 106471]